MTAWWRSDWREQKQGRLPNLSHSTSNGHAAPDYIASRTQVNSPDQRASGERSLRLALSGLHMESVP